MCVYVCIYGNGDDDDAAATLDIDREDERGC